MRGHGVLVVRHWPPTSEVSGSTPDPMLEDWKLLTEGQQFAVQNLDQLYVLVSSSHKTTHRDMICTL